VAHSPEDFTQPITVALSLLDSFQTAFEMKKKVLEDERQALN